MNQIQEEFSRHPVIMALNKIDSENGKKAIATAIRRAVAGEHDISEFSMRDVYDFGWPTVTVDKVLNLKRALLEKYSAATVAQTMTAVRSVMGACFDMGMIDGDQLKRIERVKGPSVDTNPQVGRYVRKDEIQAVKETLEADPTPAGERDLAILALMWHTGARVSEVLNINYGNYLPDTGELQIRDSKGGKSRIVRLHNGAKEAMDNWLESRGDWGGPIFCPIDPEGQVIERKTPMTRWAITKMFDRRQEAAGVDNFTSHDLRRTAASELIELTGIRKAQRILGHADISVTARYDRSELEAALEASGGREF